MRALRGVWWVGLWACAACAAHGTFRPVDWFEVRRGGGGLAATMPAGPGGIASIRRSAWDESFWVKSSTGTWKPIAGPQGASIWVLAGGKGVILEQTLYVEGSEKGVELPDHCSPMIDAEGRRIFCAACVEETDEPACLRMRLTELDPSGRVVRQYTTTLGPGWSPRPEGVARQGDLLLRRPYRLCVGPACVNRDCAVGSLTKEGPTVLAAEESCSNESLEQMIRRYRVPELKPVALPKAWQ